MVKFVMQSAGEIISGAVALFAVYRVMYWLLGEELEARRRERFPEIRGQKK